MSSVKKHVHIWTDQNVKKFQDFAQIFAQGFMHFSDFKKFVQTTQGSLNGIYFTGIIIYFK
jgi:hypothetical protein